MTRTKKTLALALAGSMALAACSSATTDGVEGAIDDATGTIAEGAEDVTGTTMSAETSEAVAKLQTSVDVVTEELGEADASADVMTAWNEMTARVSTAIVAAETDTPFDASAVEDTLNRFESTIEQSDVADSLGTAWEDFRTSLQLFLDAAVSS